MVVYVANSEQWSGCNTDREQAWHLFAILLKLGHPVRPAELAARCGLFRPSPDFVEFLCSIPDSPLFLTDDKFVTISLVAVSAVGGFASKEIVNFLPRMTLRVSGSKRLLDNVKTYFRKRKGSRLDECFLPPAKRRLISYSESDGDNQTRLPLADRIVGALIKPQVDVADIIRNMSLVIGSTPIIKCELGILNQVREMIPFLLGANIDILRCGLMKIEHVQDEYEAAINIIVHRKVLESVLTPGHLHSFLNTEITSCITKARTEGIVLECESQSPLRLSITESQGLCKEHHASESDFGNKTWSTEITCLEANTQVDASPLEVDIHDLHACGAARSEILIKTKKSCKMAQNLISSGTTGGGPEDAVLTNSTFQTQELLRNDLGSMDLMNRNDMMTFLNIEKTICMVESNPVYPSANTSAAKMKAASSSNMISISRDSSDQVQQVSDSLDGNSSKQEEQCKGDEKCISDSLDVNSSKQEEQCKGDEKCIADSLDVNSPKQEEQCKGDEKCISDSLDVNSPKQEEQCKGDEKCISDSLDYNKVVSSSNQQKQCGGDGYCISMKQKLKQRCKHNMLTKENRTDSTSIPPKNQLETKALPNFKSFFIEEEEGSGGYGTVYRARRKNDGKKFAIKCPHMNAHIHHVNNERKMLERFGGKNFVIKFEGSFKSSNSECFVLEHVEHDRPEVLRREIDIFQLQWYGYCMFRALAGLHNQGVVHRDVKPGNFLFSRNLNKGYLIDFNLAMDLNQKYSTTSKSKMSRSETVDHVPLPSANADAFTRSRKVMGSRVLEAVSRDITKDFKTSLEPKDMKKRADVGPSKAYLDLGSRHKLKAQGADGSGITSTKDATTPLGERQRQPLPCQGRKELISLAQKAMQSPNHNGVSIPASQRKRIAAPPGKVDRKFFYLTPMPVHSAGVAVAGAGLFKNKGDGKQKREGPCVGTKGFRAPEVLFRSPHQGPKVDIWSAGVNMLYLMIGRTPFVGDPEQNIKDIAKLRGSEDLWEVAKLHNRESSFPVELFNIQSLQSMKLQEWCKRNTKRPDFFDIIPSSLFDLVDKCLTVNPRLRISAEEALNHEFFAPCHDAIRRQRQLRRGLSLDPGSSQFSQEHV